MAHYAQIKNNIVTQVIVADTQEWCENALGGEWVETFKDKLDRNYASIGYTYFKEKENFSAPQPFNSWVLDEKLQWQAPKERPVTKEGEMSIWNEEIGDWEIIKDK